MKKYLIKTLQFNNNCNKDGHTALSMISVTYYTSGFFDSQSNTIVCINAYNVVVLIRSSVKVYYFRVFCVRVLVDRNSKTDFKQIELLNLLVNYIKLIDNKNDYTV